MQESFDISDDGAGDKDCEQIPNRAAYLFFHDSRSAQLHHAWTGGLVILDCQGEIADNAVSGS